MRLQWANIRIGGFRHRKRSGMILFAAGLIALAVAYASAARAAGVVSSCDETSLLAAIN
jgi:hypothetical protein